MSPVETKHVPLPYHCGGKDTAFNSSTCKFSKNKMYIILITSFCINFALTYQIAEPLVNTSYGEVKGQIKLSRKGREFHSFTGIPYARPPLKELRFAEPKEPESWTTTWDARKDPPVCIQRNYLFSHNPKILGHEDCLYLNVYVPMTERYQNTITKNNLLPVMVFIHWGAFIGGRSTPGYLGPEYFMDKDVILVTFNYRVGPFGFLSTVDDEAPGNYGLKDQVAALQWVQKNIEYFGGNRNKITLFGQSAGAGSVHYHLLSPASKGLFHQAISQSGSALSGWALPLNTIQKQVSLMQAKFVGCEKGPDNSSSLIECLRNVPASEILKSQDNFRPFFGQPLITFGSVVETKSERNPNPFLTKTPQEYILNGEFQNIPWMTGIVKNEGILSAANLIRASEIRKQLNENFEKILSDILLLFSLSTMDPQSLYKNITNFYLEGKNFIDIQDQKNIQGFVDVYSDRAFFYPLYQSLLLHSSKGHKPIYLYNFEYEGAFTYGDHFAMTQQNIEHHWGPSHCDDLLYLFNSPHLFSKLKRWNDINLSDKLVTLWTNFATYGKPNPVENSVHPNIDWKPIQFGDKDKISNNEIQLLNITGNSLTGADFSIHNGFYQERMKFWTDSDIFENIYVPK